MSKPIIYLTFADQQDDHLPLLKEEISRLKELLRPLEKREFIRVERDESATVSEIESTLSAYPDQIAIFHYGGHAGGALLRLEDRDAQHRGLARWLGEQTSLRLVFLNGCSTMGQVNALLEAGAPAVIATSTPVADRRAVEFSEAFYKALAGKRTLRGAFEFARAGLMTRYRQGPEMDIVRGFALPEKEPDTLPWNLYVREKDAEAVLNWRLPYYREIGLPRDMIQYIGREVKLNRYIVLVLDAMCRYNKDIYSQMVEVVDGKEVKKDSSTYLDLVIRNFPWIIGSQIQLLRQHQQPDRSRLNQLLSTYRITTVLLYYLLLNDYWDQLRRYDWPRPGNLPVQPAQTPEAFLQTDFLKQTLRIHTRFLEHNRPPFLPEMGDLCRALQQEDSHLHRAWQYLETLSGSKEDMDIQQSCLKAEQALAVLLRHAAFLADYRMLTIRGIGIDNPRYGEVTYELDLGALNAIVNTSLSLYEDDDKRRKQNYANCKSIVLAPNEGDLENALNLSPFIIDKNAYLDKSHIDLFLHCYEKEGQYYYAAVKHSIFEALENAKGTDIIHTGMTLEDFLEGRNITHGEQAEEDFGFAEAFGLEAESTATTQSTPVFELLKVQFAQFKSDFT